MHIQPRRENGDKEDHTRLHRSTDQEKPPEKEGLDIRQICEQSLKQVVCRREETLEL